MLGVGVDRGGEYAEGDAGGTTGQREQESAA
jgi:hypothetical protein